MGNITAIGVESRIGVPSSSRGLLSFSLLESKKISLVLIDIQVNNYENNELVKINTRVKIKRVQKSIWEMF